MYSGNQNIGDFIYNEPVFFMTSSDIYFSYSLYNKIIVFIYL